MHPNQIDDMLRRLRPVLKDSAKAKSILQRYWRTRMALVWMIKDVHRAANEREVALTNSEAIDVLQELLHHHNRQYGVRWEDLTSLIEEGGLGRRLTKTEVKRFIKQDIITVQT